MKTQNTEVFESMPIGKALATLAIPSIISQIIAMVYNIADTYFIGYTDDPYKVAGSVLGFGLCLFISALTNLFGVGGGSLVSRLLGEGKPEIAKKVSAFCFYGSMLASGIFSLVLFLFNEPILYALGASSETIGHATDYVFWTIVIGAIPSVTSVTLSHLLRNEGYSKQASFGLAMGGVLNIILDPILMFVILPDGKEVMGAAMATMISNTVVLVFFIYTICRMKGNTVLSLKLTNINLAPNYIFSVFKVGMPSALSTLLASTSNMILNNLASLTSDAAVAAIGIAKKIDNLPLNVGMGICQGMMPLVAYNYAAGNYKRMYSAQKCAARAGWIFSGLCLLAALLFGPQLVNLFINDAETVRLGGIFLRLYTLAVPLMIYTLLINYTFLGIGKASFSLIFTISRQAVFLIPMLYILHAIFGLYGIMWAQFVADALTTVIMIFLNGRLKKELKQKELEQAQNPVPAEG